MNKKFKICFISRQAYPYLSGKNYNSAGGSELQDYLMARELQKRGHKIFFVVGDYGQKDYESIQGFNVYKNFSSYGKGFFGKLKGAIEFWKLLSEIDADVYYRMTPHAILVIVGLFCKLKDKIFIFSGGSDIDFESSIFKNNNYLLKLSYKYALKNANIVIAQNNYQKTKAYENFGINPRIIKSIVGLPKKTSTKKNTPCVMLIGSLIDYKQPEIFIELSKKVKESNFYIIGPCNDDDYLDKLRSISIGTTNLKFCGFIQHDDIMGIYAKDIILVNTSRFEGFPNTFLEAWSYGNPVISLNVDPDEVICKYKLGFHSRTFDKMIEDLKLLLNDKNLRNELGLNSRKYVEENHSIEKIVRQFENLIHNSFKESSK